MSDLGKPAVARAVLDALALTSEGATAAPGTVQRLRGVVVNAAEYAVERRLLDRNPITSLAWKAPRTVQTIDRRTAPSTRRRTRPRGGRLTARPPALRPAPRRRVDLAQRRGATDAGGRLGRAQRRRAADDLRQVSRGPGGRRPPPHRRRAREPVTPELRHAFSTDDRHRPVPAGHHRTGRDHPLTTSPQVRG